jgi:hypothetical protein
MTLNSEPADSSSNFYRQGKKADKLACCIKSFEDPSDRAESSEECRRSKKTAETAETAESKLIERLSAPITVDFSSPSFPVSSIIL